MKDCIYVIVVVTVCPKIIELFICKLSFIHRAGFFLLGAAAVLTIAMRTLNDADIVNEVIREKGIKNKSEVSPWFSND